MAGNLFVCILKEYPKIRLFCKITKLPLPFEKYKNIVFSGVTETERKVEKITSLLFQKHI